MNESEVERIADNLRMVNERIAAAAGKSGRQMSDVTLVTVSKTFPLETLEAAIKAGAIVLGESRIQEGCRKIEKLGKVVEWHMIGHLQSNKAAKAVEYFDLIHSLDSQPLAGKISEEAARQNKTIDCLIEVNSSGEESKYGFSPADLVINAEQMASLPGINLNGLMTIGPWTTDEERIKKAFDLTRELFESIHQKLGDDFSVLSMGMSSDYELAIECGSTMVRVGTAIFGERN